MTTREARERRQGAQISELHARLVDFIGRWTEGKEDWQTPIANLLLFRRESPTQLCSCKVEPSLVLVVQGAKQLLIGDRAYAYDPEHFLINSLDIPASSQVIEASPQKPCFGLGIKLDLRAVAELIAQSGLQPPRQRVSDGSSALGTLTSDLLEPFTRLLALLDDPKAIPVLAPLVEREILYRLLTSDHGRTPLANCLGWQPRPANRQSH